MNNMPILTIFTPAYNRAHTLPRTYESLLRQNCKDFVWLIVDDGSSDHTAELVRQWQAADNGFEIRYVYKKNGGMHTAHNTAYEHIDTELNVCIDSDDCLADGAAEKILRKWESVKDMGYAGIVGLDADFDGNVIGKAFPQDQTDTTLTAYYAAGGAGDKKLVYRTDVIKAYPPYPTFEGEKYVALAYKYRLIDQDYRLAILNEILCDVEYQADGSSNNMWRQYLTNPQGFAFWRTVQAKTATSTAELIKNCIHYCSSRHLAKKKGHQVVPFPYKFLPVLCTPAGVLLALYIKYKNK
jgi:glycosyltransferase involved in cell wall biosynthesis